MKICSFKIWRKDDNFIIKMNSSLDKKVETTFKKEIESLCKNYNVSSANNNSLILENQIFNKHINIKVNDITLEPSKLDEFTKDLILLSKGIINSKRNFNLQERE